MRIVLLDTNVAAGIFSYLDLTSGKDILLNDWMDCVIKLLTGISDPRITIPTPVFYELAQRNGAMFGAIRDFVRNPPSSPLFQYVGYSITPKVLLAASKYKLLCNHGGVAKGANFVDALLAGYCLTYNYYLITKNSKDFPNLLFKAVRVELAPLKGPKTERETVFLLEPKIKDWNSLSLPNSRE